MENTTEVQMKFKRHLKEPKHLKLKQPEGAEQTNGKGNCGRKERGGHELYV